MDLSRIIIDPSLRWGTPCLGDTDISVGRVVELHQAGYPPPRILEELPGLTADDIEAALEWFDEFGPDGLRPRPPDPGAGYARIAVDATIQGGHPVVRGTRITVDTVVGMWERGFSVDQIEWELPTLSKEDIEQAIDYAVEAGW